jgi:hypothetical protein
MTNDARKRSQVNIQNQRSSGERDKEKTTLFITRFGISSTSAIGVQTRNFIEAQTNWLHVFWSRSEFSNYDARSSAIENLFCSRYSIFKKEGPAKRAAESLGLSWWKGNKLQQKRAEAFQRFVRERVGVIYMAPIDENDAGRMRHLAQLADRPYVLHLWDILDQSATSRDLDWLIENAQHVFCLTTSLLERVSAKRSDGTILLFCRKGSSYKATVPEAKHLNIALIGDVGSYSEGLELLRGAVTILRGRDTKLKLTYIGPPSIVRKLRPEIVAEITPFGFAKTDEIRDQALSECNIAFLPGPSLPPQLDLRSKYSIPSRILDFFATGLPIAGTVHRESATASFLNGRYPGGHLFCATATELANALEEIADAKNWSILSNASTKAHAKMQQEWPPTILRRHLEETVFTRKQERSAKSA